MPIKERQVIKLRDYVCDACGKVSLPQTPLDEESCAKTWAYHALLNAADWELNEPFASKVLCPVCVADINQLLTANFAKRLASLDIRKCACGEPVAVTDGNNGSYRHLRRNGFYICKACFDKSP